MEELNTMCITECLFSFKGLYIWTCLTIMKKCFIGVRMQVMFVSDSNLISVCYFHQKKISPHYYVLRIYFIIQLWHILFVLNSLFCQGIRIRSLFSKSQCRGERSFSFISRCLKMFYKAFNSYPQINQKKY